MNEITAIGLKKSFDGKEVLCGTSFCITYGSTVRITGASGEGKTTLLRIICGLEKPDAGEIYGYSRKDIAFLFQEDRLFPSLTALENVTVVMNSKNKKEEAKKLLFELALDEKDLNCLPSELSGGMCRRVAIARALAYDRPILILDEALRGLDSKNAKNTAKVIENHSVGKTVIFVTHSTPKTSLTYTEISLN